MAAATNKKTASLYTRPGRFAYGFLGFACRIVNLLIFKRKILRNELKDAKGPFVVLANHECALDCVNVVGLTKRKMTFVVSFAFFNTLPVRGLLKKAGVIVKQQFQTKISDLKKMKAVVDSREGLVIYPAGLMTENGLSTPIPKGTWSLLKWLGVDVYVAKTVGSYFVMPKWTKGFRPGRTYMDVYKLFSAGDVKALPESEIRERAEAALEFDAYRDQETYKVKYKNGANIRGLEKVLYRCPVCGEKYTVSAVNDTTLACSECGFSRTADDTGFFSDPEGKSTDYRYASDWSKDIIKMLSEEIGEDFSMSLPCRIEVIDFEKKCFRPAGEGTVTLDSRQLSLSATVDGEKFDLVQSVSTLPYLPSSPGKRFEIQTSEQSYRCYPEDGHRVVEFINALHILNERAEHAAVK